MVEILGEEVIHQSGCFRRVRRWIKGVHPELGTLVQGYTGWETVQEVDVISAMGTFEVTPEAVPVPSRSPASRAEYLGRRNVA